MALLIKLLSSDCALLTDVEGALQSKSNEENLRVELEKTRSVPGIRASWWELAADFGVWSLPFGVLGNLLASALWEAYRKRVPLDSRSVSGLPTVPSVKLILHNGDKIAEIQIQLAELEVLRETIITAIDRVYR